MDDYLFATFLAEDIMKCVLKNYDIDWEPENSIRPVYNGKLPEKVVVLALTKAVTAFIKNEAEMTNHILDDYSRNNSPTVHEFCLYTVEFGSEIFKEGFEPQYFIVYSAIVSEMAYRLYDRCKDIPERAVGVMATVLISQVMTRQFEDQGGQEGLKRAALKLLSELRNPKTRPEIATTSF